MADPRNTGGVQLPYSAKWTRLGSQASEQDAIINEEIENLENWRQLIRIRREPSHLWECIELVTLSALVSNNVGINERASSTRKRGYACGSVIPPVHPFDGTGDQFDEDNSNIVQLFSLLKKDNSDVQMVYYQAGIGTYTSPNIATPLMAKMSKTLDEMVAWNLDRHVMDGYEFLMQNYKADDRICIFGFSRGAYTARALAGMIHKATQALLYF
ncbi:hypothetical protein EYR38_007469 [Pleurotus pulmonarius]|nr:hypothetical protein EYR38_007469 [Pleurotus pulmonarius]